MTTAKYKFYFWGNLKEGSFCTHTEVGKQSFKKHLKTELYKMGRGICKVPVETDYLSLSEDKETKADGFCKVIVSKEGIMDDTRSRPWSTNFTQWSKTDVIFAREYTAPYW